MVTFVLVLVAVLLVLAVAVWGYAMFTDRGLFNRLCAYNAFSAALACLGDVLAALFGGLNS